MYSDIRIGCAEQNKPYPERQQPGALMSGDKRMRINLRSKTLPIIITVIFYTSAGINPVDASDRLNAEIQQLITSHVLNPQAKYLSVFAGGLGETDRNIQFRIVDQNALQLFLPVAVAIEKGSNLAAIQYSPTQTIGLASKNSVTVVFAKEAIRHLYDFFKQENINATIGSYEGIDRFSGAKVAFLQVISSPDRFTHQEAASLSATFLTVVCHYDDTRDGLGGAGGAAPVLPSAVHDRLRSH